jgi:hypothetical protein
MFYYALLPWLFLYNSPDPIPPISNPVFPPVVKKEIKTEESDASDLLKVDGIASIEGKAADKQQLLINNLTMPLQWGDNYTADSSFDPSFFDGRKVKFKGVFDGKSVIVEEVIDHPIVRKITPHLFFEGEAPVKDDVLFFKGQKIELNFIPLSIRQAMEKSGRLRVKGSIESTDDVIRFLILSMTSPDK